MLHYRSAPPPPPQAAAPAPADDGLAARILNGLTLGILAICLGIWAIVGAVFWIPLLIRTMVLFSVALIQATLDGKQPAAAAQTLREAVTFYRRGFIVTRSAVMGEPSSQPPAAAAIDVGRLMRELVWAAVIWWLVLAILGFAWSPTEIWTWLVSGPIGTTFGRLGDAFWSVIYG
jgi:hypothetical protein